MKIAIIGAGLGGLSTACLLAHQGHDITVFEKNEQPGGKINQIKADGFRFDTGPSLLTLPGILETLFSRCGESLKDYLTLKPVDPICRYFYPNETVFNCHHDIDKTINEIQQFAPEDQSNYRDFLRYAETLYERTYDAFLQNPLYNFSDLSSVDLSDIFKIDAFKTVAQRVDKEFESHYMRQFFKRFATYNGSSPFQAPATLNVIPHVELSLGGYYVDGGMYKLVEALIQLAKNKGVKFQFGGEVEKIHATNRKASGIQVDKKLFPADLVISNSDATETYLNLLPRKELPFLKRKKLEKVEPSCSGFVLLLGINKKYDQLSHHNIFFSNNYEKEFDAIFNRKVMPDDPTIYIANTSSQNPDHAIAGGSNLFVLINAPYLSDNWDWQENETQYGDFIIKELEKRGLNGLRESIRYQNKITPIDFYSQYHSNEGSIYGTSSNGKMAAFLRPKNKASAIDGLYLTGGSTHPGGGIPLVILSAFHAVELIGRFEG